MPNFSWKARIRPTSTTSRASRAPSPSRPTQIQAWTSGAAKAGIHSQPITGPTTGDRAWTRASRNSRTSSQHRTAIPLSPLPYRWASFWGGASGGGASSRRGRRRRAGAGTCWGSSSRSVPGISFSSRRTSSRSTASSSWNIRSA